MLRIVSLCALLMFVTAAPTGSANWAGPVRLPWYNQQGDPLGCPGAGAYKRWKKAIAVRPSDPRFKCGDKVELRYGKQRVVATVMDSFSESAPSWVIFDAAAIINCNLLLPRGMRPKKEKGYVKNCSTLSNVYWRKIS